MSADTRITLANTNNGVLPGGDIGPLSSPPIPTSPLTSIFQSRTTTPPDGSLRSLSSHLSGGNSPRSYSPLVDPARSPRNLGSQPTRNSPSNSPSSSSSSSSSGSSSNQKSKDFPYEDLMKPLESIIMDLEGIDAGLKRPKAWDDLKLQLFGQGVFGGVSNASGMKDTIIAPAELARNVLSVVQQGTTVMFSAAQAVVGVVPAVVNGVNTIKAKNIKEFNAKLVHEFIGRLNIEIPKIQAMMGHANKAHFELQQEIAAAQAKICDIDDRNQTFVQRGGPVTIAPGLLKLLPRLTQTRYKYTIENGQRLCEKVQKERAELQTFTSEIQPNFEELLNLMRLREQFFRQMGEQREMLIACQSKIRENLDYNALKEVLIELKQICFGFSLLFININETTKLIENKQDALMSNIFKVDTQFKQIMATSDGINVYRVEELKIYLEALGFAKDKMDQQEGERTQLQSNLSKLQSEYGQRSEAFMKAQSELDTLQAQHSVLNREFNKVKEGYNAIQETLRAVSNKLVSTEDSLKEKNRILAEMCNKQSAAEQALQERNQYIEALRKANADIEMRRNLLSQEALEKRLVMQKAKEQITALESQLRETKSNKQLAEQSAEQSAQIAEQFAKEKAALLRDIELLRQEYETSESLLNEMEKRIQETQEHESYVDAGINRAWLPEDRPTVRGEYISVMFDPSSGGSILGLKNLLQYVGIKYPSCTVGELVVNIPKNEPLIIRFNFKNESALTEGSINQIAESLKKLDADVADKIIKELATLKIDRKGVFYTSSQDGILPEEVLRKAMAAV